MVTQRLAALFILIFAFESNAQVLEDYAVTASSSTSDPTTQGWTLDAQNNSPAISSWSSSPLAWKLFDNNADGSGFPQGEYEFYYVNYSADTNWITARTSGWRMKATLRVDHILRDGIPGSYAGSTMMAFRIPAVTVNGNSVASRMFDLAFGSGDSTDTSPVLYATVLDGDNHLSISPSVGFQTFMDVEVIYNPTSLKYRVFIDRVQLFVSGLGDFAGRANTGQGNRLVAWGVTNSGARGISYWKSFSSELFPFSPSVSDPQSIVCRTGAYSIKILYTGETGVTYQWKKNGSNLSNGGRISGANSDSLTISGARISDDGAYTCDVTRGGTTVISEASTLIVCVADFNCDGFIDGSDYDAYVTAFEAPEMPEADTNDDGFLDFFDYDLFVTAFESGCNP